MQHDMIIANQTFPEFRTDLNNALQSLASMQSGSSAPSTTYANMLWYDTTNNVIKMRNEANDAWIALIYLDQENNVLDRIANLVTARTGSVLIPTGSTAERDGSPASGYFRFNTSLGKFEGYNGSAWGSVGGGATGGGSDDVFYENGQTVNTNYTITTDKNAMSAGPISIASGVTVTVPTGSTWVVL